MTLKTSVILIICSLLAVPCAAASDVKFTGYVDTSYNYLTKNHQYISGINDRENDITQNGFTLQQAAMTLSLQPAQGLGGLVNIIVGRDTYWIASYGWNPYFGSQTLGMVVPAAYLQYATSGWTFMGGLLSGLIGEEDYDPNNNTNFSRSLLDDNAEPPTTLMGVRATYKANDKLTLNAGVNNGWSGIRDTSRQKSVELGVSYTFNPKFSLQLQGLSGEQRLKLIPNIATGPTGRRDVVNLIATFNATTALTLVASGDYGLQTKALASTGQIEITRWQGITGYVNYKLNDAWRTSVRGEVFDDPEGFTTGVRQNLEELTLTIGYIPMKHVELRAETRHDFSNVNSFMNATGPGVSNNQQSYALEALYNF